ncbi:hypothetical protein P3L10_006858 [Capsicum annuum]
MANFYTSTSVLFMFLLVSNLLLFSQGRNLAITLNLNVATSLGVKVIDKKESSIKQLGRSGFRFMEGSVDAFSSPGHSPGIGHSKHD